ncbi:HAD-IA family hydrolase [Xinfangfangia sp. D13-10-4-6]|uniref:HAD-IA family hydrolase n=1 Tax=Pseudogemmobacter hezensis TaxID=2737662 RepID=UPI001557B572|nr:HAD-IA family hydrolase [Pseudogemmobacter hezensis]NPD15414.1 HAD-IA family hydrolase [Pseudogemmobacter hezensis]
MKPEAVIFDIGRVLIGWDPIGFYDREIGEDRRHALFDAVDLLGMNEGVDAGDPFRDSVFALADRHPEWAPEIRLWYERWHDMASPRIEGSIRLRDALRAKGIPVFALTNFGDQTWDHALPRLGFLADFDRLYISGRLRMIKPDPAIYAHVEADCGIAPERLLFTDDRADNITAAARRGWRTHQFESWQGWAERLVAEELLTRAEAGI